MPIDASVVGSPGWWMNRLSQALSVEQRRFRILEDYYAGRPPLAWGSENVQKQFYRFQRMSRSNFASVVVEAPCERIALRAIRTGADNDAEGDDVAWRLVRANGLQSSFGDATRMAKKFGRSYLATAHPDEPGGQAIITAEDPRQVITEADPVRPGVQRAALKLYYDAEAGLDVSILWLPGQKWVATRERKGPVRAYRGGSLLGQVEPIRVRFNPSSFTMAPKREDGDPDGFYSEEYDDLEIPVDPLLNRDGVGEFELHVDLLDRINHMILQRVVIATLQAFRQRALKQSADPNVPQMPDRDENGNLIDYSDILESGPDAVWLLPPGADLWESGQVDLQGILQSAKDDILHLSAVTKTPLSMFTPDAISQSAEGAQLTREGLTFKVEDFWLAGEATLARTIARAFRYMGDTDRGDASQVSVSWKPAERRSLSEMAAAAGTVGTTLTWEQQQEIIWQQDPAQIRLAKTQRAEDMVLAQQQAALAAAQQARASAQPA
ncbi:MAG: phage portal protein [Mycobacteriaceae bacterium]